MFHTGNLVISFLANKLDRCYFDRLQIYTQYIFALNSIFAIILYLSGNRVVTFTLNMVILLDMICLFY